MGLDYHYVIGQDVVRRLGALPKGKVRQLVACFEYLARNPDVAGQDWTRDATGRRHEALLFGTVTLVFWIDHAAREVRIVEVIED